MTRGLREAQDWWMLMVREALPSPEMGNQRGQSKEDEGNHVLALWI